MKAYSQCNKPKEKKPTNCDQCKKDFSRSDTLVRHQKKCTGPKVPVRKLEKVDTVFRE